MKKLKPESVGGRTRNVEGGYRKGKSMGCGKVLGFDAMEEAGVLKGKRSPRRNVCFRSLDTFSYSFACHTLCAIVDEGETRDALCSIK